MDNKQNTYADIIKTHAERLGFLSCGISRAEFLEAEAPRLEKWLRDGMHGQMAYMENHFDKRLDPTLLVPGAKSVVSLLYNYYPDEQQREDSFKISKYAYGEDYHYVVKDKLKELMHCIHEEIGAVDGRVFVDSAPVLDKAWAAKSGLGWIGKHSNLLSKKTGSFFFVAELIIDLDLTYDHPVTDHCGSCTACIDACPTQAIIKPYVVDGSKCISYATIELKDSIPGDFSGQMDDWMFGCDVCQDVCPWNRFSKAHNEPRFKPKPQLLQNDRAAWQELTEEVFGEIFKKSAVKRTKFSGLMRNIAFLRAHGSRK
ncbi:tRNA epoxyqueuosine(34) reductase QueG [Gilvibacter sp.]|uniref:tRNA epoxyqueuosine(34) reductase QueG n=1 Tax=Gilvibacter sp. TaxID=2729997 RepID=UPI0025C26469|nr:tRNA epoxyqueuosine(34) reductase QueG [Gilvibacter sp.]NQX76661.1 tRNA epoxyqueuosine(34) reductase QueG [Gilvibacter sp.]